VAFLAERLGRTGPRRIASVHFGLNDPLVADARQRLVPGDMAAMLRGLRRLDAAGHVAKYVLMNARLHRPERYFSRSDLDATADRLALLLDEADLDGLVFADPYQLQALSDARPEVAARLEAVPSVNAGLDSPGRALALLDMIADTAFRPPSRLVLDRPLNRDMARLQATAGRLRQARPGLAIHLMANEGCLLHCPFKPAHDAHIALVNEGLCGERTFAMNRDLGCLRRMLAQPGLLLASPFIRPEDTAAYAPLADGIKLCGRNRGTPFLMRVTDAYLDGAYPGNLLDLMDAMGDLADRISLPNGALPADFLSHVTECGHDCADCGWCSALVRSMGRRTDPGLPRL
jgi:hypothetical protein